MVGPLLSFVVSLTFGVPQDGADGSEAVWKEFYAARPPVEPASARDLRDVIGAGGGAGGSSFPGRYGRRGFVGGGRNVGTAVDEGLAWLARQQQEDGSWPAAGDDGADVSSGLAVLAFLGRGHALTYDHSSQAVRRALRGWMAGQGRDGRLGGGTTVVGHAIVTAAFAEVAAMDQMVFLRGPLKRACDLLLVQLEALEPGERGFATRAWCAFALWTAAQAKVVDPQVASAAIQALERDVAGVSDRRLARLRVSPDVPMSGGLGVRSHVAFLAVLDGRATTSGGVQAAAKAVADAGIKVRTGRYGNDIGNWMIGGQLLWQTGGTDWRDWSRSLVESVLKLRETNGDDAGSWPARTVRMGKGGGPVYATAMAVLALEAFGRFDKTTTRSRR